MSQSIVYPDVYGWIDNGGPTAHDQSGTTGVCYVFKRGGNDVYRSYFSFDTSSIPTNATVSAATVRTYLHDVSLPSGIDLASMGVMLWYEHDKIGGSIDTGDWDHSSYAGYKWIGSWPLSLPNSFDVIVVTASVNKGGDSDYEFREASTWSNTINGPLSFYHAKHGPSAINKMWLTVTWTAPLRFFNRFNWRLPRLPGFSNILAVAWLPCGRIQVTQRFPVRVGMAEA